MDVDEEERKSQKSKVLMPRGILGQKYKRRREDARSCLEVVMLLHRLDRGGSRNKS